jgi:hypothetical protein
MHPRKTKFREWLTALCLILSVFSFSGSEVEIENCNEAKAETVIKLQEGEPILSRRTKRTPRSWLPQQRMISPFYSKTLHQLSSRYFSPSSERDKVNGSGSHLRI